MKFAHDKVIFESECEQETLFLTGQFYRENFEEAIKVLSEVILKPVIRESELNNQINNFKTIHEEQFTNPVLSSFQNDFILQSCFENSLGNSSLYLNENLTPQDIKNYIKKYFIPQNISIAASGVQHNFLEDLVKKYFKFENNNKIIDYQKTIW